MKHQKINILPCPFCGNDPIFNPAYIIKDEAGKPAKRIGGSPYTPAHIYCECQIFEEEGAYGDPPIDSETTSLDESNQQAVELWNHRPGEK